MYKMRALSSWGETKASTSCVILKMAATQNEAPKALLRVWEEDRDGNGQKI
jgi:hypothetical protein